MQVLPFVAQLFSQVVERLSQMTLSPTSESPRRR
jgi:hypothetical protein